MSKLPLHEALKTRTLLCDGATGTELQKLGLKPGQCGELWNVDHPELVSRIHTNYAAAGSDILTTNTFGGTRFALSKHGLEARQRDLNRAGAALARQVAGETRWVLGDLGPCGDLLEPYGDVQPDTLFADFKDQSLALLEGGADALLVETMSDPNEAALATRAAKEAGAVSIVVTYAFQRTPSGFRTMMGTDVVTAVSAALEAGANIVGSNCGTSLSAADYEALGRELLAAAKGVPVILQPNAGSPIMIHGEITYKESVAELATLAHSLRNEGVRILGGCCGTNPEHIRGIRAVLS